MRRLCVLVCLLAGPGCMSDADHGPFADALKDARGDNMRMRSDMSRLDDTADTPRLRAKD